MASEDFERIASVYERIKSVSAERLSELKQLGSALFEHIPAKDLAFFMFPPTLGLDVLTGILSGVSAKTYKFDPHLPHAETVDAALDLAKWFSVNYFKTSIQGVEKVPEEGPVLLVGNHSAGLMPMDALFAMNAIRECQQKKRIVHPLVHDFAYASPNVARNAQKMGILKANHENAGAALADNRIVLAYPGGDQDAFRLFSERKKIILAGRKGFVRLALENNAPIVPLVSVGLHESFVILSKGKSIAEKLNLKKILRTDIMPIALSFPWGIGPAFMPFLPIPTNIEMQFCDPIMLEGSPDDDEAVTAGYKKVEAIMQSTMDELNQNRIPLFGRELG